jgi:transposase
MDMWSPYRTAVERHLPQADIVADRFHVTQNLNRAVTKARRDIQREAPAEIKECLKGSRWVLVKNRYSKRELLIIHLGDLEVDLGEKERKPGSKRKIDARFRATELEFRPSGNRNQPRFFSGRGLLLPAGLGLGQDDGGA